MNFDRAMEGMDSYCDYDKLQQNSIVLEVYSCLIQYLINFPGPWPGSLKSMTRMILGQDPRARNPGSGSRFRRIPDLDQGYFVNILHLPVWTFFFGFGLFCVSDIGICFDSFQFLIQFFDSV